jgi:phthiodiolone/phenolphthiodiolone dimycocerosates ketoreductase
MSALEPDREAAMPSRLKIANYAYGGIPLEAQVDMAVQAEADGWDYMVYWDQANGWTPRAIYTPDITPLAAQVPSLDVFYDAGVAIGQAAMKTERIGFWNAVVDCVRRPPYVQALNALTLDHATKGRNVTVYGSGEIKQLRAYGHKRIGANDKLWDTVHIVKKLMETPEPVTYEGRQYSVDRAMVALQPYGEKPPPIWVAGGTDEVFHLAGAVADGWVTYGPPGTEDDPQVFAAQVAKVHEQAKLADKSPEDVAICFMAMTMVHPDPKVIDRLRDHPHVRWMSQMVLPTSNMYKQWNLGPHPMGDDWAYAVKMDRHWMMTREEGLDVCDRTPREAADRVFFTGSPEEVAMKIKPYLDAGATDLLIMNVAPIAGEQDYRPELRDAIRAL